MKEYNTPLITIVIATYNADKTLKSALDSIINQTYSDWECLIIDGASQDNTLTIIKEYKTLDKRIKFISEPDTGIYDAFNKGWKLAKGEWIYYLGADDQLLNNGLQSFYNNFSDTVDIIYGNIYFKAGQNIKKGISPNPNKMTNNMACHQCICMRKECIKDLGGFDYKYKVCADYALIQKALKQKKSFKHFNAFVAIFNCSGISSDYKTDIEVYKIDKEFKTCSIFKRFYKLFYAVIKKSIKKTLLKNLH